MRLINLLILAITLTISSCSFPRFIILKDPLSPEEHVNLGVAYEKRGEFEAAIKEYEMAANSTPIAYLYLGNVYLVMKDYERAEEHYKRAIEEDPKNADAYNNLAWLYYVKGERLDEAEILVLRALELNPSGSAVYMDTLERIKQKKR